jgi:hypothetical protein
LTVRAYTATSMTGRTGLDLFNQSLIVRDTLDRYGIDVLDPVAAEGVLPDSKPLKPVAGSLAGHWRRDKEMIRKADVLIDLTPTAKSEGVAHEIGLARYCYWIPVVRIYSPSVASIAHFEDDLICPDLETAAREIVARWGTWRKRFVWRLKLYARCAPKHYFYKLKRWFQ